MSETEKEHVERLEREAKERFARRVRYPPAKI
jgi:hypothetical protein